MTVHIGQITSEVTAPGGDAAGGHDGAGGSEWDERCRLEATLDRVARDRLRTATGWGHD